MRSVTLLIFLLLPVISFSQVGLKYVHVNWNVVGHFDAPNFRQYINAYNLNGPKPPGVTNYGFKIRGADALSFMTGFGTKKGRVLFTLSYVRGSTLIDRFGDAPKPEWKKSLHYDYNNIGAGLMLHLLKSKNKNSEGLPRIEYQIGFDREFNRLQYADKSGPNNKYKTNNFGASTFIQYNFYVPYLGGAPIRVVWGVNLRYHASLNPVDFSSLQNDLNFHSSNKLSDGFKDLTLGVTLGFMSNVGSKRVKEIKEAREKIKPTDFEINAFARNPMSMLELSAVDSVTGQPINAKYDVLDEQKQRPVVLLNDKYLVHSVFKNMLTVYVTARAKGYFVREVAVEGYDTLKVFHEIELRKIPQSPVGVFYFEQSSSKMKDDYISKIDSLVSVLQRNQHMNIAIVGHTSADGSSRLNRTLSLKRAKVIRKLLLKRGVDDARITATGAGSAQPKAIRDTEESQSANRRVEVFLRD
jgi:outer membrane protein OmpA-like peptidoglycan-associated protein